MSDPCDFTLYYTSALGKSVEGLQLCFHSRRDGQPLLVEGSRKSLLMGQLPCVLDFARNVGKVAKLPAPLEQHVNCLQDGVVVGEDDELLALPADQLALTVGTGGDLASIQRFTHPLSDDRHELVHHEAGVVQVHRCQPDKRTVEVVVAALPSVVRVVVDSSLLTCFSDGAALLERSNHLDLVRTEDERVSVGVSDTLLWRDGDFGRGSHGADGSTSCAIWSIVVRYGGRRSTSV